MCSFGLTHSALRFRSQGKAGCSCASHEQDAFNLTAGHMPGLTSKCIHYETIA